MWGPSPFSIKIASLWHSAVNEEGGQSKASVRCRSSVVWSSMSECDAHASLFLLMTAKKLLPATPSKWHKTRLPGKLHLNFPRSSADDASHFQEIIKRLLSTVPLHHTKVKEKEHCDCRSTTWMIKQNIKIQKTCITKYVLLKMYRTFHVLRTWLSF